MNLDAVPEQVAQWWNDCLAEMDVPEWQPEERIEAARVMLVGLATESGGRPDAVGDNGHSIGLFQLHDQGAGYGLTVEERKWPGTQFRVMGPKYRDGFAKFWSAGLKGADLAVAVCGFAERPLDPSGYGRTYTRFFG